MYFKSLGLKIITVVFIILSVFAFIAASIFDDDQNERTSDIQKETKLVLGTTKKGLEENTTENSDSNYSSDTIENTFIMLQNEKTTINGKGASLIDGSIYINSPGTYTLKGVLSGGKIYVGARGETRLIFDGVNISSKDTAVYFQNEGYDNQIYLADGSENKISFSGGSLLSGVSERKGVIMSASDLNLFGNGSLEIEGNALSAFYCLKGFFLSDGKIKGSSDKSFFFSVGAMVLKNADINIKSRGTAVISKNSSISMSHCKFKVNSELCALKSREKIEIENSVCEIKAYNEGDKTLGIKYNLKEKIVDEIAEESEGKFVPIATVSALYSDDKIVFNRSKIEVASGESGIICAAFSSKESSLAVIGGDRGLSSSGEISFEGSECNIENCIVGFYGEGIKLSDSGVFVDGTIYGFYCTGRNKGKIELQDGTTYINSSSHCIFSKNDVVLEDGALSVFGEVKIAGGKIINDGGELLIVGESQNKNFVSSDENAAIYADVKGVFTEKAGVITDKYGNIKLGFFPPKKYSQVIYSSPMLDEDEKYDYCLGYSMDEETQDFVQDKTGYSYKTVFSLIP